MSSRGQARLWVVQRASAVVLAFCVVVHLLTMIYAVRGGLTAAEILGRTRGSVGWGLFYTVFVLAVASHASIGLRTILGEWAGLRGRAGGLAALAIAACLAILGLRAVAAVVVA